MFFILCVLEFLRAFAGRGSAGVGSLVTSASRRPNSFRLSQRFLQADERRPFSDDRRRHLRGRPATAVTAAEAAAMAAAEAAAMSAAESAGMSAAKAADMAAAAITASAIAAAT